MVINRYLRRNWTQSTDNSRLVMCPIDSYFRVKIHNRVTINRKSYCDVRQQYEFFQASQEGTDSGRVY